MDTTNPEPCHPCAAYVPPSYRDAPMSSTTPPVLRLKGVSFVRDERTILAPLDWTVKAGERWLVLGANGSAKTTLLRMSAGLLDPTGGSVPW